MHTPHAHRPPQVRTHANLGTPHTHTNAHTTPPHIHAHNTCTLYPRNALFFFVLFLVKVNISQNTAKVGYPLNHEWRCKWTVQMPHPPAKDPNLFQVMYDSITIFIWTYQSICDSQIESWTPMVNKEDTSRLHFLDRLDLPKGAHLKCLYTTSAHLTL